MEAQRAARNDCNENEHTQSQCERQERICHAIYDKARPQQRHHRVDDNTPSEECSVLHSSIIRQTAPTTGRGCSKPGAYPHTAQPSTALTRLSDERCQLCRKGISAENPIRKCFALLTGSRFTYSVAVRKAQSFRGRQSRAAPPRGCPNTRVRRFRWEIVWARLR